jgi:hypothetical protein
VCFLNFVVKMGRAQANRNNPCYDKWTGLPEPAMAFDAQSIFANLTEKERLKGHHSPEGRAIRTLSRALNGWSSGNLSALDVLVLWDQALEEWLKARLQLSAWSTQGSPALLEKAVAKGVITRTEAVRLQKLHRARTHARDQGGRTAAHQIEAALEFSIQLVERYW